MAEITPPPAGINYPQANFPTVFADGVMSLANSPTVVKFFLSRTEPNFAGDGTSINQAFAQVVMSMDGFAGTFAFFETAIKRFIAEGYITDVRLDELRQFFIQQNERLP
jgi:hypothetical protein